MSHIRQRSVTTADGVRLDVRETGDPAAQPLVLVHGFGGSADLWAAQLQDPELTSRHRVVAPDLRGHGSSQTDLDEAQLVAADMDGHARLWSMDLDAVRADLAEPVLVGWSFGGAVVQSHVHAHGGLGDAAAVVLLSAPPVLGPVPEGDPAAGLVPPAAVGALVGVAKDETRSFAERVLARGEDDASVDPAHLALLRDAAARSPLAVRSAILGYAYDFRPTIAALPAGERERMTALIAEHDQLFSAPAMHTVWEQAGVRTVAVTGEGHALGIRDPSRFRDLLLDVLATSRPAR